MLRPCTSALRPELWPGSRAASVGTDPAWKLLPTAEPAAPVVQALAERGRDSLATFEIPWPRAAASADFDLHFVATGVSSLGTFRAPQVEVADSRPCGDRWPSPSIRHSNANCSGRGCRRPGAVPEFVARWGAGESRL